MKNTIFTHLPDRLKSSTIFSSQILVLGTFLNYIHVSPQGKLQIFWDFSPLYRVSTCTQPKSFTLMMMTVWWSSLCKNLWPTQSGHKTWTLLRLCVWFGVNHSGIGFVMVNLDLPIWIDEMNIEHDSMRHMCKWDYICRTDFFFFFQFSFIIFKSFANIIACPNFKVRSSNTLIWKWTFFVHISQYG